MLGLAAHGLDLDLRSHPARQIGGEGGGGQVRVGVEVPAVAGPHAMGAQHRGVAAGHDGVQRAGPQAAPAAGVGGEGPVDGQAQGPGERAASGLGHAGQQGQGPPAPQVEAGVHEVGGAKQAADLDRSLLAAAAARQPEPDGDGHQAPLDAEGRQRLHAGVQGPQVDGHGPAALGARALGSGDRPAHHANHPRIHLVDPRGEPHEGARRPAHTELVDLDPRALGVRDRRLVDGEASPDVALQALHLEPPELADLQAGDGGLDQMAPGGGERPVAADGQDGDQDRQGREHASRPLRGPRVTVAARRGRRGGGAQNACPMLR